MIFRTSLSVAYVSSLEGIYIYMYTQNVYVNIYIYIYIYYIHIYHIYIHIRFRWIARNNHLQTALWKDNAELISGKARCVNYCNSHRSNIYIYIYEIYIYIHINHISISLQELSYSLSGYVRRSVPFDSWDIVFMKMVHTRICVYICIYRGSPRML